MDLLFPQGYKSPLNIRETENAIKLVRELFEAELREKLNLERASAPLFVRADEGLNDDLSGKERAVSFDMLAIKDAHVQVVHSLAKWKRLSLKNYGYHHGEGIYTNMNAIRRDEELDNIHSVYVDQWDWEKVISEEERTVEFLKKTVDVIVSVIADVNDKVHQIYPVLKNKIKREVTYITSQELLDLYPHLSAKERENAFVKEHGTVFLMGIGDKLSNGLPHDGRAPDYDDWALNGDILIWNPVLEMAFELSSMGIRVTPQSLREQLEKSGNKERENLLYHKMLLAGELPLSIGGGIGQSRLCMLVLEKAHIGEVHSSIWPKQMLDDCHKHGIDLL